MLESGAKHASFSLSFSLSQNQEKQKIKYGFEANYLKETENIFTKQNTKIK